MSPTLFDALSVNVSCLSLPVNRKLQSIWPFWLCPLFSHPDPAATVMSLGDALPPEICNVAVISVGTGGKDGGADCWELTVAVMLVDWPGESVTDCLSREIEICPGAAAAGCGATATLTMLAAVAKATNSPAYARIRGRIQDRRCAVTSTASLVVDRRLARSVPNGLAVRRAEVTVSLGDVPIRIHRGQLCLFPSQSGSRGLR